ncbi:MAG: hypothetical protein HY079_09715 [Elusimicrobia bacterium]|nr:hypothetical protein [Elusimicrobiota bacterium]
MSVLREPRVPGPVPARAVASDRVVVAGPAGRAAALTAAEHAAFAAGLPAAHPLRERLLRLGVVGGADPDALARDLVETGLLNWPGPREIVLVVSGDGETMLPETAKDAVDFAFATPRPALALTLADLGGSGWPAARFAVEYARRKAEWGKRGLMLTYRAASAPAPDRDEVLAGHGAAFCAELAVDGPAPSALPPAPLARAALGPGARDPEGWADLLASRGVSSVRWVPTAEAVATPAAARRTAAFMARALGRMIERAETADLRDELALGLLAARPWEIPGLDLLDGLAVGPDGRVWTSEAAWRAAEAGGGEDFLLGHCATLRFPDLPSLPIVPAIAAAAWRPSHPTCEACAYRSFCSLPASSRAALDGPAADSPSCAIHMALLDAVFARLSDEKCLKALEKWGVDISRLTC